MGWIRFALWVIYTVFESALILIIPESKFDRLIDRLIERWTRNLLRIAAAKLKIVWQADRAKVIRHESAIVVSNHQSYADIVVLERVFPKLLRMFTKTELYALPVFGQAMAKFGHVRIDRKAGKNDFEPAVKKLFEQKKWLYLAPEGTRSKDGILKKKFRSGAFWLAHKFNVPIIVVGLKGSRDVLPKGSLWISPHKSITATVLDVLDPTQDPDTLKAQAYQILSRHLDST